MKIVEVEIEPGIVRHGKLSENCLDGLAHRLVGNGVEVVSYPQGDDGFPWHASQKRESRFLGWWWWWRRREGSRYDGLFWGRNVLWDECFVSTNSRIMLKPTRGNSCCWKETKHGESWSGLQLSCRP